MYKYEIKFYDENDDVTEISEKGILEGNSIGEALDNLFCFTKESNIISIKYLLPLDGPLLTYEELETIMKE